MIIRIEPKDWNMHSVVMFFKKDAPHAEDARIREYLRERGLEPRRQYDTSLEGEDFQVMAFGGCYLGRHMNALAAIQRAAVEREILAEAVPALLANGPDADARRAAADMPPARLQASLAALIDELHAPENFAVSADGDLVADIDAARAQARFMAIAAQDGVASDAANNHNAPNAAANAVADGGA